MLKYFLLFSLLSAAACSPIVDNRGHLNDAPIEQVISTGITTKDDVTRELGSPSSTSDFGEEVWYYINSRREVQGMFKPKVTDHEVVAIRFDEKGVVKSVERHGKDDGKDIAVVEKITPTEGHQLGFIEQLLGNVGRFNKAGSSGALPRATRPGR